MKYLNLFPFFLTCTTCFAQPKPAHNLVFNTLPQRWDEAIPLGNGWLGALLWQKDNKIRLSLDRVDCWDDRPMPQIDRLTFKWVQEQVRKNQYDTVQQLGDLPYEKYPAPTKIPVAALEFDRALFGDITKARLDISNGLSVIEFSNQVHFNNYIHANQPIGYFGFENLPAGFSGKIIPRLIMPGYQGDRTGASRNSVDGQSLSRLGYPKGTMMTTANSIRYRQSTWKNNYYEVLVHWKKFPGNKIIGAWTITINKPAVLPALQTTLKEPTGWDAHLAWWNDYWSRSSIALPDAALEKQYYLEMYKFACVARSHTPPISLQAIWTADNGQLPPWKGDLHHDLNTQLSYWPGYSGNHLDLTAGFTNWLWKVRPENKRWTKQYFGTAGLNVPGVTTISGKPMGGWIQYSMSPSTATWLAQHFYWQGIYSMDKKFFREKCLPYFEDIRQYLEGILVKDTAGDIADGKLKYPLGSSPEYHDNSIKAWFTHTTSYDNTLLQNFLNRGIGVSVLSGHTPDKYQALQQKIQPTYTNETGYPIAYGQNLEESHRHHAHLMSIYPLQTENIDPPDNTVMQKSLRWLEQKGTRKWTGYSFAWAACLYARAAEADSAVKYLQVFASNFCSPNSFHLNGDQKGGQYSDFTYQPFTLEGNFAFAQGIHELLLQNRQGYIEVFPAVPASWKDVSFKTLRAEGAFLISATKENGIAIDVTITAEQGGQLVLRLPKTFFTWYAEGIDREKITMHDNKIVSLPMKKGQIVIFKNGFE